MVTPIVQSEWVEIPFGSPIDIMNQQVGWDIDINFKGVWSGPQAALEFEDSLRAMLIDGSNRARTVEYCEWEDTDENIARIYRNCTLASWPVKGPEMNEIHKTYSFVLRSKSATRYSTFSDGNTPGTSSPWETSLYGTTATTSGGESDVVSAIQFYMATNFKFDGALSLPASNSNMQLVGKVPGPSGATMRLVRVRNQGCGQAPITGVASVIRVSSTDYNSAGSGVSLTLSSSSRGGDTTTGAVDFTANDTIYCYPTTAGTHTNLNIECDWMKV